MVDVAIINCAQCHKIGFIPCKTLTYDYQLKFATSYGADQRFSADLICEVSTVGIKGFQ